MMTKTEDFLQVAGQDRENVQGEPAASRWHLLQRGWLLPVVLLASMLYPIWATPFPAFGDYWNHLLQANVVLHYPDPAFGYAAGYELVPQWYLNTTALSTVVLVGLGRIMPIGVAGQVLLSLYMVLFLGAFKLLLDRRATTWPLILLTPLVAYNFTFSSGFINFGYAIVLGLFALHCYLKWVDEGRARNLGWMAVLLLFTAHAHVLAWLLWLVVIGAMAAVEAWKARRLGALYVAMNSALPLLLWTRPSLGLVALAIGPALWVTGWLTRKLRVSPGLLTLVIVVVAGVAYQLRISARLPAAIQNLVLPFATYNRLEKQVTPFKLLTIPHQFAPPNDWLTTYNLGLLALSVLLIGLLVWSAWRDRWRLQTRWVAAVGALLLGYFLLPTNTYDIVTIEPRVLLVAVLVTLVALPIPHVSRHIAQGITVCLVGLWLLQTVALVHATQVHGQQTAQRREQLATMAPAQNVLVFYENDQRARTYENFLRYLSTVYAGQHLVNLYGVEQGGMVSVTFNNGPVRFRPEVPLPEDWSGYDRVAFVNERCADLRIYYGAVVALFDAPSAELVAALDGCFGEASQLPQMWIWRTH